MKFLQEYFSIIFTRLMVPPMLFSKYMMGSFMDSPIAFLAAKCMMPWIGFPLSFLALKTA